MNNSHHLRYMYMEIAFNLTARHIPQKRITVKAIHIIYFTQYQNRPQEIGAIRFKPHVHPIRFIFLNFMLLIRNCTHTWLFCWLQETLRFHHYYPFFCSPEIFKKRSFCAPVAVHDYPTRTRHTHTLSFLHAEWCRYNDILNGKSANAWVSTVSIGAFKRIVCHIHVYSTTDIAVRRVVVRFLRFVPYLPGYILLEIMLRWYTPKPYSWDEDEEVISGYRHLFLNLSSHSPQHYVSTLK